MRIGVDLGGTKIEAIALGDDGLERERRRIDTPRGDYQGTVRAIAGLVGALESALGQRATVGVGIPGSPSPRTGLIRNANSTWLNGRTLDRDLGAALERDVRIANDANCFAVSEAIDGGAAGAHAVFGVIVGTGCGGGVVIDGRSLAGHNGIAGEWGHNELPHMAPDEYPGPTCWCGLTGCIETFISGTGFARDHAEVTGEPLAAHEIVAKAEAGEAAAVATLARYESRMARALSSVINLFDPDVIVLGGGMSNVGRLYETVPRLWQGHVFSDGVETTLVPPKHGDSSGVRGAAWLWGPGETA